MGYSAFAYYSKESVDNKRLNSDGGINSEIEIVLNLLEKGNKCEYTEFEIDELEDLLKEMPASDVKNWLLKIVEKAIQDDQDYIQLSIA